MKTKTIGTMLGLLLIAQHSAAGVITGNPLGPTLGDSLGTFLGGELSTVVGSALPFGIGGAAGIALVSLIIGTQLIKRKK